MGLSNWYGLTQINGLAVKLKFWSRISRNISIDLPMTQEVFFVQAIGDINGDGKENFMKHRYIKW
ncbi:MAG: hypothetical protein IPI19_10565 [Ignavibacteriales bacterium]|nr:hypothetical protein [Ignavibacteriales bacterium]